MDDTVLYIRIVRGLSTKIARALGISRSAVYQWKQVPPHWVQDVAEIIGSPPEQIRPDLFFTRQRLREMNAEEERYWILENDRGPK